MTDAAPIATPAPKPHLPDAQTVTQVKHWTDRLFSFRVTRPKSLRFRSGEFVMIGLMDDKGKPLLRAYSIASPSWDEELEFYSIKVPDGPLTSRLQHIQVGDEIVVKTTQGTKEETFKLRVVGRTDKRAYGLQPSLIMPILTWEKVRPQAAGAVNEGELTAEVTEIDAQSRAKLEALGAGAALVRAELG